MKNSRKVYDLEVDEDLEQNLPPVLYEKIRRRVRRSDEARSRKISLNTSSVEDNE